MVASHDHIQIDWYKNNLPGFPKTVLDTNQHHHSGIRLQRGDDSEP